MVPRFEDVRQLMAKRDRLKAALEQADFELRRALQELRDDGMSDDEIREALGRKPRPRLVRAEEAPPRQSQPPRVDGRAEGFWTDE